MIRPHLILTTLLIGCAYPQNRESTIQQEQRETVTGKSTSEVIDKTISEPAPVVVEGRDIKVTVPPIERADRTATSEDSESSDSSASGKATWSEALPWGISLILLAIGLFLLAAVLKRSRAVRTAWEYGNDMTVRMIHRVQAMAAISKNDDEIRTLTSIANDIERERADLNKPL